MTAAASPAPPPGTSLTKQGIVLPRGAEGAWDGGMVESPVVWFDQPRQRYGMVYTGYAWADAELQGYEAMAKPQVGLAWSDNLLRWEKDPRNPIFGPTGKPGDPDAQGTPGPFIWHEKILYYLFYFGTTATGYEKGTKTLNMAISPDLVTWTRYPGNPIITPYGTGWRTEAIWHPNIVKASGTYYLFFNASGIVDGVHEEFIGYAMSKDLFIWTVDDTNAPVLMGSGTPGAWDATGRAGDPSVFRVGHTWYMAYYSWDGIHTQDGLAWTTEAEFPLGWRPYENNPVLPLGAPGSFDALHAGKPFIFRTPERHFHFYTAVDDDEIREIAVATAPIR